MSDIIKKPFLAMAAVFGVLAAMVSFSISGLPWIWIALILGIFPLLVLAVKVGDLRLYSFYLFVFLLPFAFQKIIYNPMPEVLALKPVLVMSISDVPLFFFFVLTISRALKYGSTVSRSNKILMFCFLGWILAGFISVLNSAKISGGVQISLIMLCYLFKLLAIFMCLSSVPLDNKALRRVVVLIVTGVIIQGCIVLAQHFGLKQFGIVGVTSQVLTFTTSEQSTYSRASGTLGHVNAEAEYFSLTIPLVLSLFMFSRKLSKIFVFGGILLLSGVALVLTFSRGGWMGTIFACIFCILFVLTKKRLFTFRAVKLMFMFLFVILTVTIYFRPMLDRLLVSDKGATSSRIRLMETAMKMFYDHPVIGVGINNFQEISADYGFSEKGSGFYKKGRLYLGTAPVHNRFLLTLAETGILGLCFFTAFIISILVFGFKYVIQNNSANIPIAIGLFSAFLGSLFYMQVEIFSDPTILTLLILIISLIYNCRSNDLEQFTL